MYYFIFLVVRTLASNPYRSCTVVSRNLQQFVTNIQYYRRCQFICFKTFWCYFHNLCCFIYLTITTICNNRKLIFDKISSIWKNKNKLDLFFWFRNFSYVARLLLFVRPNDECDGDSRSLLSIFKRNWSIRTRAVRTSLNKWIRSAPKLSSSWLSK